MMFSRAHFQKILYVSGALSFAIPFLSIAGNASELSPTYPSASVLNPADFHMPETAREVITKRTERSATFEVSPGKYASVSASDGIFTRDIYGQLIPTEQTGRKEGDTFVFDRLSNNVRIRFDLLRPRYTVWQDGYSFTVSFAGNAKGVIENDTTIAYQLGEGTILRWNVTGNSVQKNIHVSTAHPADLSFRIVPSNGLTASLADDVFTFVDPNGEQVFSTEKPFLTDTEKTLLPTPVHIVQQVNGSYTYVYNAAELSLPYIIDPTSGPLSGGTFSSGGGGTIAWSNPSNAASQNGTYASAAVTGADRLSQLLNATNFSFPIASNDTIDGVMAEIYWSDNNGGAWSEDTIMLIKNGSTTGTDKGIGATPSINTYTTYGGAADLWGATLGGGDVNASNFGFAAGVSQEFGTPIVRIDHMRMTVYYTLFVDADANVSGPTAVPFFSWWSLSLLFIGGAFILSRYDLERLF
ncbi:hypothetical protein K8942_00325 [Candidatus Peribacteria bacterium]|nr:MAG: hypothetical protein K8942_00325 [Candidatus Peribacteria bacterium]